MRHDNSLYFINSADLDYKAIGRYMLNLGIYGEVGLRKNPIHKTRLKGALSHAITNEDSHEAESAKQAALKFLSKITEEDLDALVGVLGGLEGITIQQEANEKLKAIMAEAEQMNPTLKKLRAEAQDISADPLAHKLMNVMLRQAAALGWDIDLSQMNVTPASPQSWNTLPKPFRLLKISDIVELISMQVKNVFGKKGVAPIASCVGVDGTQIEVPMIVDWNRITGLHWKPPIIYRREEEGPFSKNKAEARASEISLDRPLSKAKAVRLKGREWVVYYEQYFVWDENGKMVDVAPIEKRGAIYPDCYLMTNWVCPLHTNLRFPEPGKCPLCEKELIDREGVDVDDRRRQSTQRELSRVEEQLEDHLKLMKNLSGGERIQAEVLRKRLERKRERLREDLQQMDFKKEHFVAFHKEDIQRWFTVWPLPFIPAQWDAGKRNRSLIAWFTSTTSTPRPVIANIDDPAFELIPGGAGVVSSDATWDVTPRINGVYCMPSGQQVTELELTYPEISEDGVVSAPKTWPSEVRKKALDKYEWQKLALERFSDAMSGMVEACTGAGKTRFCVDALKAVIKRDFTDEEDWRGEDGESRVAISIIVPTIALLDQWRGELENLLQAELKSGEIDGISIQGGGRTDQLTQINIFTLKTASILLRSIDNNGIFIENEDGEKEPLYTQDEREEFAEEFAADSELYIQSLPPHLASSIINFNTRYTSHFLIVDEAHRSTAKTFKQIYEAPKKYTLLVTATFPKDEKKYRLLEEQTDSGMLCVYRYPHALKKGNISKFKLHITRFNLSLREMRVYAEITTLIDTFYEALFKKMVTKVPDLTTLLASTGKSLFEYLAGQSGPEPTELKMMKVLGGSRSRLSWSAGSRLSCALHLIEKALSENKTIIVFHKSVPGASALYKLLYNRGWGSLPRDSETGKVIPKTKEIEELEIEILGYKEDIKDVNKQIRPLAKQRKYEDAQVSGKKTPPSREELDLKLAVKTLKQNILEVEKDLKPLMDKWNSRHPNGTVPGHDIIGLYHSQLPPEVNASYLEAFRDKGIRCLISVQALLEGLDVPHCDVGIAVAADQSDIKLVQALGRVLRIDPDTPEKDYYFISAIGTKDQVVETKFANTLKDTDGNWIIPPPLQQGCPEQDQAYIDDLREEVGLPTTVKIDSYIQSMTDRDDKIECPHCHREVTQSKALRAVTDETGRTFDPDTGEEISSSYICTHKDCGKVFDLDPLKVKVHIEHPKWVTEDEIIELESGAPVLRVPPESSR